MEDWKTALGVPAMDCLKFVTVESRLNGEFSFLSCSFGLYSSYTDKRWLENLSTGAPDVDSHFIVLYMPTFRDL